MDEFILVNEAKEALCYVSKEFKKEMNEAMIKKEGLRSFDREFVLPNFADTFHGFVRLPIGLRKENEKLKDETLIQDKEKDMMDSNIDDSRCDETKSEFNDNNSNSNEEDSDEESEEQMRKRIMKQREEEKKRKELEEQERQVLSLSVERFTVPEVLFYPTDIGLNQAGLADAIVQSIIIE